jgi:hypothetical protein
MSLKGSRQIQNRKNRQKGSLIQRKPSNQNLNRKSDGDGLQTGEKRLRTPIRSDGGKLCLFPSYLKKEPVYSLDCRKCEQDPDSPFKQCAKLWEEALSTQ